MTRLQSTQRTKHKWVTFTYTGKETLHITNAFKHTDPKIAFRTKHTIENLLKQRNPFLEYIYRVIHKSVKLFKNSQQIDYATDHGNCYVDRERNCLSFFKGKARAHCCPDLPLGDSSSKYGVQYRTNRTRR